MASLIGLFYESPVMPVTPSSHAPTDEAAHEALRESMRRDFETLLRQAAPVYERLPSAARRAFLPTWSALQGRMDRAHQEGTLAEFQAALVEAKALLAEAQPDDLPAPARTHWVYQAWSRVLDAEVWFVHCTEEAAQLAKQGVRRGSIYMEVELVELLRLPHRPGTEALKTLHAVKSYFDATVVSEEDDDKPEAN
jgi:hypothetical protein